MTTRKSVESKLSTCKEMSIVTSCNAKGENVYIVIDADEPSTHIITSEKSTAMEFLSIAAFNAVQRGGYFRLLRREYYSNINVRNLDLTIVSWRSTDKGLANPWYFVHDSISQRNDFEADEDSVGTMILDAADEGAGIFISSIILNPRDPRYNPKGNKGRDDLYDLQTLYEKPVI